MTRGSTFLPGVLAPASLIECFGGPLDGAFVRVTLDDLPRGYVLLRRNGTLTLTYRPAC